MSGMSDSCSHPIIQSSKVGAFDLAHALVPLADARMLGGKAEIARIQKVREHSPQVEIDEARNWIEQKISRDEHLLEREEFFAQLGEQFLLLFTPLFQAMSASTLTGWSAPIRAAAHAAQ